MMSHAVHAQTQPTALHQLSKPSASILPPSAYGTYIIDQDPVFKRENKNLVEAFIEGLPLFIKPIAAPKLRKAAQSFKHVEFEQNKQLLGIKTDRFPEFAWTQVNGEFHNFKNTPKGDFELRRWIERGHLFTEVKKGSTIKHSEYQFTSGGLLLLTVTVQSKYLPAPLSLRYRYKKRL